MADGAAGGAGDGAVGAVVGGSVDGAVEGSSVDGAVEGSVDREDVQPAAASSASASVHLGLASVTELRCIGFAGPPALLGSCSELCLKQHQGNGCDAIAARAWRSAEAEVNRLSWAPARRGVKPAQVQSGHGGQVQQVGGVGRMMCVTAMT